MGVAPLAFARSRPAPATLVVALLVLAELTLIALHGFNHVVLGDGRLLSLDQEANVPTWFSSLVFALAALACALVPLVERRGKPFWLAAGILLTGMSVDEIAMFHETSEAAHGQAASMLGWQLFAALGLALLLWLGGSRQPPHARRWARAAAAATLFAHLAAILGSLVIGHHAEVVALSIAEEWAEMLIGTFALAAAVAVLSRYVAVSRAPSS